MSDLVIQNFKDSAVALTNVFIERYFSKEKNPNLSETVSFLTDKTGLWITNKEDRSDIYFNFSEIIFALEHNEDLSDIICDDDDYQVTKFFLKGIGIDV